MSLPATAWCVRADHAGSAETGNGPEGDPSMTLPARSRRDLPPATYSPSISTATASTLGPDTIGFRSSGQSPGEDPLQSTASPRTVHLIGPGQVGRAFLRRASALPVTVVAISDSTATVFDKRGLDVEAVLAHKAKAPLAWWPRAEAIPTELAIAVVGADIVVDATPTDAAGTAAAVERGRAALRSGAFLCLCAKNALAASPGWLLGAHRGRVGIDAVLGGTGQKLVGELDELRAHCRSLSLVGNVTTTVIVQAIERGASVQAGIDEARARGLLEADPTCDFDGSDAATKLVAVWGAVFGDGGKPPAVDAVRRDDVRDLDPRLVQARARRGATTRLIARGSRNGDDLRVRFEELPAGSPLAAPPDRVVYGYELDRGLRVHTGLAVGYERTAQALVQDVVTALGGKVVRP